MKYKKSNPIIIFDKNLFKINAFPQNFPIVHPYIY